MIVTSEVIDVLRDGWQDAGLLAADVPEVGELLAARLEVAIVAHRLDEGHLLAIIDEVESIAVRAGSASGQALGRRLRRTVYEYLLALDAVRPADRTAAPDDAPALADIGVVPVDEVVAVPADAGQADPPAPLFLALQAGFHIVDGDHLEAPPVDGEPLEMPVFESDSPGRAALPEVDPEPASTPGQGADGDLQFVSWQPAPMGAGPIGDVSEADVAVLEAALRLPDAPEPAAAADPPGPTVESASFFELDAPAPAAAETSTADGPAEPASPEETPEQTEDDGVRQAWRVRSHGQAGRQRGVGRSASARPEADPFENNPALADTRRRIEERLRRKRCDEAAALLQALAHDPGGRSVADLAMNAGDRCRVLGKSNAALNCYLAASRSDPVYELPLSRLADVCIDTKDTDLAVTYLERIARLQRFRGEDADALRVYRRIAALAPDREDVLALLMNAQRSGRLG